MYEVMTIRRQTEGELVCATRLHERVAGVLLILVVSPLVFVLLEISVWGVSRTPWSFLLACGLVLPGSYIAFSSRRFAFTPDSKTCVARLIRPGIFCRRRQIEFREVVIRRQFHWRFFRRLYFLVLVDSSRARGRPFPMGYVCGRGKAEALARTIAGLTKTVAVDPDGEPLASWDGSGF